MALNSSGSRVKKTQQVLQQVLLVREIVSTHSTSAQGQNHGQHFEAVRVRSFGRVAAFAEKTAGRCRGAEESFPLLSKAQRFLFDGLDDVGADLFLEVGQGAATEEDPDHVLAEVVAVFDLFVADVDFGGEEVTLDEFSKYLK